jgi:hypothetical protein
MVCPPEGGIQKRELEVCCAMGNTCLLPFGLEENMPHPAHASMHRVSSAMEGQSRKAVAAILTAENPAE